MRGSVQFDERLSLVCQRTVVAGTDLVISSLRLEQFEQGVLAALITKTFGFEHRRGVLQYSALILADPFDRAAVAAYSLADLHLRLELGRLELLLRLLRRKPGGSNRRPIPIPQLDG